MKKFKVLVGLLAASCMLPLAAKRRPDVSLTQQEGIQEEQAEQRGPTEDAILKIAQQILRKTCVIERIQLSPIDPVSIVGRPITITVPGSYILVDDLTAPPGTNAIVIKASDVKFDFSCYTVNVSGGGNAVVVQPGEDNVLLVNGTLRGDGTGTGIDVQALEDNESQKLCFEKVTLCDFDIGINWKLVDKSCIRDCRIFGCETGIQMVDCESNLIERNEIRCGFSETVSTYGIRSGGGEDNLIQRNIISDYESFALNGVAAGISLEINTSILLTDTTIDPFSELGIKIINNCIYDIVGSDTCTCAFGINLVETFTGISAPLPVVELDMITSFSSVNTVHWRHDGKFLVVAGEPNLFEGPFNAKIHKFDGLNNVLTQVATIDVFGVDPVNEARWSPDGKFIAFVGDGGDELQVFAFNPVTCRTALVDSLPVGYTNTVAWSPDGKFIVIGITTGDIEVYRFDGESLALVVSIPSTGTPASVDWCPTENVIAVGTDNNTDTIFLLSFDGVSLTAGPSISVGDDVQTVVFSPDGNHLAVGFDGDPTVRIYSVDKETLTLTEELSFSASNGTTNEVAWSPDGKLLGTACNDGFTAIFLIDCDCDTDCSLDATLIDKFPQNIGLGNSISSIDFNPNGRFIATGRSAGPAPDTAWHELLSLDSPTGCVVQDNIVYGVCGGFRGIGVRAASFDNIIVGNRGYNSDINFAGATNIYIGGLNGEPAIVGGDTTPIVLLGGGPSALQNVSLPPY